MFEILTRLQRIEDILSNADYRSSKDTVRKLATADCHLDDRCSSGLYDPVASECFDIKFKVSLGQHCFHIDTIEQLLNQQGIVMKPIPLHRALQENKYVVNPLTDAQVPLAKIIQRLTYIINQPYYKVHKTSLREVTNAQLKKDNHLEIERQKKVKFKSVVQLIGGPLFGAEVINASLTIRLMNVLEEINGPVAPSFEELQEVLSFEGVEDDLKHLITKEYTEKTWNSFAKLFNSLMKSS